MSFHVQFAWGGGPAWARLSCQGNRGIVPAYEVSPGWLGAGFSILSGPHISGALPGRFSSTWSLILGGITGAWQVQENEQKRGKPLAV